jgi:hypothetical protein
MTHCLTVVHKIDGPGNKKLQLYKQWIPQTLSIPLVRVWNQVVTEYTTDHKDETETLATFAQMLKSFLLVTAPKMTNMSWLVLFNMGPNHVLLPQGT